MEKIKVLGICGSLRDESRNMGMLRHAASNAPEGLELEIVDLREIPFYVRDDAPHPPALQKAFKQMEAAQGFVFACPEYNYSVAPALKNLLDWASREKDNRLIAGKTGMVFGAGGGMGTSRSQLHLRQIAQGLDIRMLTKPEVFANAFSESFSADGKLLDPKIQGLIVKQLEAFLAWTRQLRTQSA